MMSKLQKSEANMSSSKKKKIDKLTSVCCSGGEEEEEEEEENTASTDTHLPPQDNLRLQDERFETFFEAQLQSFSQADAVFYSEYNKTLEEADKAIVAVQQDFDSQEVRTTRERAIGATDPHTHPPPEGNDRPLFAPQGLDGQCREGGTVVTMV